MAQTRTPPPSPPPRPRLPTPEDLGQRIRAKGLRRTKARVAILGALHELGAPLTHGELRDHPRVAQADPVTVYRALSTLVDVHLIHRVQGPDGVWRYCPQPQETPGCPGNHAHFWCEVCETMGCLLDQPIPRVNVPEGAEVIARSLVVLGRCAACGQGAPRRGEAP